MSARRVTRHRAQQPAPLSTTDVLAGRIRKALYGITDNFDSCLDPASRAPGSHARAGVFPPLPINADILDKRALACARLRVWSALVMVGRRLQHLAADDACTMAAFLLIHVDWLAAQDAGPQVASQLEASAADLGQVAADNAPHRFGVGRCPGYGTSERGERVPCTGVLRVVLRRDDDLLPSVLACTLDPAHTWAAGQWRILGDQIHASRVRSSV